MQKKVFNLKTIKSVIFVRLGKLGDMMIASRILRKTRQAYPHLKIGLITLNKSRELFRYNDDVDVLKIWQPLTLPVLAVAERLRGWDLLVDLNDEPSRRSILAKKLVGGKHSIAFNNRKSEGVFEKTIPTLIKEKSHVLQRLNVMAAALGMPFKANEAIPAVSLKPGLKEEIIREREALTGKGKKVIAINLSAGHASRYWAVEKWESLIRALVKKHPKAFIKILCSPADIKEAKALAAWINSPKILPVKTSNLHGFLAEIAASDMLITPDTSAVHAACALGVPVLGLYPEPYWNFVSWKPSGKNNMAIRSKNDGVDGIGLDEVCKAALKMAGMILR